MSEPVGRPHVLAVLIDQLGSSLKVVRACSRPRSAAARAPSVMPSGTSMPTAPAAPAASTRRCNSLMPQPISNTDVPSMPAVVSSSAACVTPAPARAGDRGAPCGLPRARRSGRFRDRRRRRPSSAPPAEQQGHMPTILGRGGPQGVVLSACHSMKSRASSVGVPDHPLSLL